MYPSPFSKLSRLNTSPSSSDAGNRHRDRTLAAGQARAARAPPPRSRTAPSRRLRSAAPRRTARRGSRPRCRRAARSRHTRHDERAVDVQPHQPRRFLAAADRERVPPEAGAAQARSSRARRRPPRRVRESAGRTGRPGRSCAKFDSAEIDDRIVLAEQQREAVRAEARRERDDERQDPHVRDDEPVQHADRKPRARSGQHRRDPPP